MDTKCHSKNDQVSIANNERAFCSQISAAIEGAGEKGLDFLRAHLPG
jgi:hypothetical protein